MQFEGNRRMGTLPLLLPEAFVESGIPSPVCSSSSSPQSGYIEHHVSKMDTLAGVAIKYGVEVDSRSAFFSSLVSIFLSPFKIFFILPSKSYVKIFVAHQVADIKRMNSLITDLQMFALKTLKIPLPGRHPPSPITPTVPSCKRLLSLC